MYYYLNGTLAILEPGTAVVDCGGVGYICVISAQTEIKLSPNVGKTVRLYTYLSVREDAMELFGFYGKDELGMFKMLISVSGVGARTAIAILGSVTPDKFAYAVTTGDVKAIKAPGVGPKIAARIILELKDKVAKEFGSVENSLNVGNTSSEKDIKVPSNKLSEARNALMALGFTRQESEGLMSKIDCSKLTTEEIIREALKRM